LGLSGSCFVRSGGGTLCYLFEIALIFFLNVTMDNSKLLF
jgi:hypothetical protein